MFRSKSRDEAKAPGTDEQPAGFVRRLRSRLNRGNSWLTYDLANLLPAGRIDDATLDELETRLISADVGLETSTASSTACAARSRAASSATSTRCWRHSGPRCSTSCGLSAGRFRSIGRSVRS